MNSPLEITELVDKIEATVRNHALEQTGAFARWRWQNDKQTRELGINEYGCADAANILYTISRFPQDITERQAWVAVLQDLQKPKSGLYEEATHHPFHTTAHCLAALELFDALPKYPLAGMAHLSEKSALENFLENLDWHNTPWQQSHQGAGIYAARVIAGEASADWQNWYFDWLWENADPESGMWRRGAVSHETPRGIFTHLAGTFHYLFNQEYARRPLRYPQKLVDTCFAIRRENWYPLGNAVGFAEIDWVYCLSRAVRQSGHRWAESQQELTDFAQKFVAYLHSLDTDTHDGWNDLHSLFGTVCALAELQQALPGLLRTERPLKLVLDRRPFI